MNKTGARRGGAITGRVTYADGDPAVGVSVHLLRRAEGDESLLPQRPDRDYVVVALALVNVLADPEAQLRRHALDAPRVTLRPDEEKSIDITAEETKQ